MIFTFYSYKGGVGRTMAMANIAEYWYAKGGNVLMIDWDLESPGLEYYFPHIANAAREHLGLVDMLLFYKDYVVRHPPPDESANWPFGNVSDYLIDVYPPQRGKGTLRLLSAGKRDGSHFAEYAERVKNFDWMDFYEHWEGERYFELFRREIENLAPIILIDSRSGVNEMNGVCTYQLADVIVALTSPNQQSMEGTVEAVKRFTEFERLSRFRPARSKLSVIAVPARVDPRAEVVAHNRFRTKFKEAFDCFVPKHWKEAGRSLWDLSIPYVSLYAFEELVAIREESAGRDLDDPKLVEAYKTLWNTMVDFASPPGEEPWRWRQQSTEVLIVEDSPEWQEVLKDIITSQTGGMCEVAATREEAMRLIEHKEYRLILLNLNLTPELGYEGVDILSFLQVTGRATPVVIITGATGTSTGAIFRRFPNVRDILFKGAMGDRKIERQRLAPIISLLNA